MKILYAILGLVFLLSAKTMTWSIEQHAFALSIGMSAISLIWLLSKKTIILPKIILILFLFLFYNLLLLFVSPNFNNTVLEILRFFSFTLSAIIGYNIVKDKNDLVDAAAGFSLLGVLVLFYGIYLHYSYGFVSPYRIIQPFGWHNQIAGFFLLVLPISVAGVFLQERKDKKIVYGAVSLILLIGLVLTYSRGGWVCILLSSIFILFIAYKKKGFKKILSAKFGAGLFVLLLLLSILIARNSFFKERVGELLNEFSPATRTVSGNWRLSIYRSALKMFSQNPLLGIGFGNFGDAISLYQQDPWIYGRFAHNQFLQVLGETGIFGFLIFTGFFVAFFILILNNPEKDKIFYLGLLGAISASFIHNLLDVDWNYLSLGLLFWLEAGMLMGMIIKKDFSLRPKKPLVIVLILLCVSLALFKINLNFTEAKDDLNRGQTDKSIGILENLVKVYPLSSENHRWLFYAYYKKGKLEEAEKEGLLWEKYDKYMSDSAYELAKMAVNKNDFRLAENYFREAINLAPYKSVVYYRALALLLMQEGRTDEAEGVLRSALFEKFPLNDAYKGFQYMYNYTEINLELWRTTDLLVAILKDKGKNEEAALLYERLEKNEVSKVKLNLNQ